MTRNLRCFMDSIPPSTAENRRNPARPPCKWRGLTSRTMGIAFPFFGVFFVKIPHLRKSKSWQLENGGRMMRTATAFPCAKHPAGRQVCQDHSRPAGFKNYVPMTIQWSRVAVGVYSRATESTVSRFFGPPILAARSPVPAPNSYREPISKTPP